VIPEIGHFLLWLALGVALTLGVVPLRAQKGDSKLDATLAKGGGK